MASLRRTHLTILEPDIPDDFGCGVFTQARRRQFTGNPTS